MRWTSPCSASVGAYTKIIAPAPASARTEMAATACRRALVIEHVAGGEGGDHDEEYVEVEEQRQRLPIGLPDGQRRSDGLAAHDHERDPERQHQHRQQQ